MTSMPYTTGGNLRSCLKITACLCKVRGDRLFHRYYPSPVNIFIKKDVSPGKEPTARSFIAMELVLCIVWQCPNLQVCSTKAINCTLCSTTQPQVYMCHVLEGGCCNFVLIYRRGSLTIWQCRLEGVNWIKNTTQLQNNLMSSLLSEDHRRPLWRSLQ